MLARGLRCLVLMVAGCTASSLTSGCVSDGPAPTGRGPYSDIASSSRDPQLARQLHAQAARLLAEQGEAAYPEAESLLRQALDADIYNGPAHNNLGIILLTRGELYEAASEFEWARKLMPGHSDPRTNLALTLERAGKTDEALDAYDAALAVAEGYLPAIQGKASLQVRTHRANETTPALLDEIAIRSTDPWRQWAELWKVKLRQP